MVCTIYKELVLNKKIKAHEIFQGHRFRNIHGVQWMHELHRLPIGMLVWIRRRWLPYIPILLLVRE